MIPQNNEQFLQWIDDQTKIAATHDLPLEEFLRRVDGPTTSKAIIERRDQLIAVRTKQEKAAQDALDVYFATSTADMPAKQQVRKWKAIEHLIRHLPDSSRIGREEDRIIYLCETITKPLRSQYNVFWVFRFSTDYGYSDIGELAMGLITPERKQDDGDDIWYVYRRTYKNKVTLAETPFVIMAKQVVPEDVLSDLMEFDN